MQPYPTLTVSGQARLLRTLAFNALQQYALPVTRLSLVTNDLNSIFRLDVQGGQTYIPCAEGHPDSQARGEQLRQRV